jgi:hypothetical protein
VILIETRVELEPGRQESDNLEFVVFGGLVVDGILSQVLQVVTNNNRKFDFLLDIVRQVLQPQYSDRIGLSGLDTDGCKSASRLADIENDRSLVSVVDGKSDLVHVPNDVVSFDGRFLLLHNFSLFVGDDTKSAWLGLKVFVAVGIDLEADVVNFKSTGIPSS